MCNNEEFAQKRGKNCMKLDGLHEKEIFDRKFPFRVIVNREQNFNYPPHWHNAAELVYVLKSGFTVIVNSRTYELNEKEILYIPGGDIHEFCARSSPGERVFINFELSGLSPFGGSERIYALLHSPRVIDRSDEELHSQVRAQIEQILEQCDSEEPTAELFNTARIIDILVLLCRTAPIQANIWDRKKSRDRSADLAKIRKSFDYIETHYSENIRLKDVARDAGFSEYYFSRLFKETMEVNFHQYLNEYRVRKAEYLLTNSNYTVSEIAYGVGFSSISTFDRLFRSMKGCSPQEFRKLRVGI
jgi:AraC-like DNA-binding protein/mannose-6-phosphate isomerase-like protein (cupin superfamily)